MKIFFVDSGKTRSLLAMAHFETPTVLEIPERSLSAEISFLTFSENSARLVMKILTLIGLIKFEFIINY